MIHPVSSLVCLMILFGDTPSGPQSQTPQTPGYQQQTPGTPGSQQQMPGAPGSQQQQQPPPPELFLQGGATVQVDQFVFQGNDLISTDQLEQLVSPFLSRALSQSDLNEIKSRIRLLYQIKGFTGTHVTISGSPLNTIVTITIVEGTKED